MRVLFLGTTGLQKNLVMEGIAEIAIKEKFQLPNMQHTDAKRHIQIYDIDNRIKRNLLDGYTAFMDDDVREKQIELWKKELESILSEIEKDKPEHVFLSCHGVYYRYNNYFSIISHSELAKFSPDVIITLIDDIYDVSDKVTTKELEYRTNSSCNISEALGWRTVETLMADKTAEILYNEKIPKELKIIFGDNVPHFILSVKHNCRMFYRLLFERKRLWVYSSFPITSTRTDKAKTTEINEFKKKLEEDYIVFDPSTIDEYLIIEKKGMNPKELYKLKADNLIQDQNDDYILLKRLFGNYSRSTDIPASLKIAELEKIKETITKHIEKRDYRMVHQSQVVAAYRPFWGGRRDPAGGVDQEITWALDLHRGALAYHNSKEDKDQKLMFTGIEDARKFESLDEMFKHLEILQKQQIERLKNVPDAWEKN